MTQKVTILGATGSIGENTLDVISRLPDDFSVFALAAYSSVEKMFELVQRFSPQHAVLVCDVAAEELKRRVRAAGLSCSVSSGTAALAAVSSDSTVDIVVAAIVGSAGLVPTLAAVQAGKKVLLANKESLVMAGQLFMDAVQASSAQLLPVDSEHNAIFQCLPERFSTLSEAGVEKILLTGSGGPFRERSIDSLVDVTVEEACAHPNWSMGRKISVDSATMMNKGLEFIEACWLFRAAPEDIDVIIHPQSIIHSMVRYCDGSVLAQMGQPDMRTPIAHCLGWPKRVATAVDPLDFFSLSQLTFQKPCTSRYPCLQLAFDAMQAGGSHPAAMNAANEVAVDAFLNRRISFTKIAEVVEKVLEKEQWPEPVDLDVVITADRQARELAQAVIEQPCNRSINIH